MSQSLDADRNLGECQSAGGDCRFNDYRLAFVVDTAALVLVNQYDVNLQVVGDSIGDETVVRGDPDSGRYSVISLRGGEIVGGTTINSAKDMAALRRLVGLGVHLDRSALEDPTYKLKQAIPA